MSISCTIQKRYSSFVLDVSFEQGNGVLALLGASGAGKSLTLRSIAGLERPEHGKIIVDDRCLFDASKRICRTPQQRNTGFLFQNYALFPQMSVAQNLACGLREGTHTERRKALQTMLERFHLETKEDAYPHQLSGGQKQRVALARMLLGKPCILLLDEPFSALDAALRGEMMEELQNNVREFGKTVLFVSHQRDEVYRLSDRTAIVQDGRIDSIGETKVMFESPKTVAAAKLVGFENCFAAQKTGLHQVFVSALGQTLAVQDVVPDETAYVCFRAEDVWEATRENQTNELILSDLVICQTPLSFECRYPCKEGVLLRRFLKDQGSVQNQRLWIHPSHVHPLRASGKTMG